MHNFLEYSVSYGLLVKDEKILTEAIEAGVDFQKVRMNNSYPSTLNKNFSALWFAWSERKELYPLFEKNLTRVIDLDLVDFMAELIKTTDGLNVLKQQVDKGLDLSKVKDGEGNNLLHLFFNPLNSYRWTDSVVSMPYESLEFILSQKVDPNALNHQGKAPLHQVISFRGDKDSGKKVGLMLKYKADLCLEDAEGITVITRLLEVGLQSAEMIRFLKKVKLTSGIGELKSALKRSPVSSKLIEAYLEKGALSEYKMLEYYPTVTKDDLSGLGSVVAMDAQVEPLLKEERMKDFLQKLMGTASSRMTNLFLEYHKSQKSFNYRFTHSAIVGREIFMKEGSENPDYLFQLLSQNKVLYGLNYTILNVGIDQTVGFLKHFSHKQALSLLESIKDLVTDSDMSSGSHWNYCSKGYYAYDTIRLFWKYPQEMLEVIQTQKFSSVNTFTKMHDFIAKEAVKIQQKPYDLEQDKVHPEVSKCEKKPLEELNSYRLIVPKTNHELIIWGSTLGNCVGGGTYAEFAKRGSSIILGIESDNQLKYCIEIVDRRIKQVEGKQRMRPPMPLMKALEKTLVQVKLINKGEK